MRLTDILKPENIKVPLEATNKNGAISEMVHLLAVNGQVSLFHMMRWRPDVAIFVGCGCAGAGAAVGGGGGAGAEVGPGGVSGPISIPGVGIRGMDRLSALTAKAAAPSTSSQPFTVSASPTRVQSRAARELNACPIWPITPWHRPFHCATVPPSQCANVKTSHAANATEPATASLRAVPLAIIARRASRGLSD